MSKSGRFHRVAEQICESCSFVSPTFVGAGAFKETYRIHTATKEPLALKVFDPAKCNVCRAEREIDSMRRCDSPYIGRLHRWGSIPVPDDVQHLYMVEDFFDGGTLADRMKDGLIDVGKVCKYGQHFAHAIEHLRTRSLVHRDIKPDNVMFRCGEDVPALVDFGLVRDLTDVSLTMSYLQQGPGTPFFASPEQLNNEKELIDWRSDQFSVGVVLGICLTGQHPCYMPEGNHGATVDRVRDRKGCSKWFRDQVALVGCDFLMTMVAPWPVERFRQPSDILDAIGRRRA